MNSQPITSKAAERLYLVVGPQSSGTRIWTSLLMRAGCQGTSGHKQRLDELLDPDTDKTLTMSYFKPGPLVWRRSFPHGEVPKWPRLRHLVAKLPDYQPFALVCTRDWFCMMQSQVHHRGGISSGKQALKNISLAYTKIFAQLNGLKISFFVLSYEALLMEPKLTMRKLVKKLRLREPARMEARVFDGNEKWLKGGLVP